MCWTLTADITILLSMPSKNPEPLDRLLNTFIERFPQKKAMKRGMVLHLFPKVVGDRIASECTQLKFNGTTLLIRIPNASWRHEVHMQRFSIQTRLNAEVKEEIIKEIVVLG
jgi:predicted nucleic acid-binding Zn ribbon protein